MDISMGDKLRGLKATFKALRGDEFTKGLVGETGHNILRKVGNTAIKICDYFGW